MRCDLVLEALLDAEPTELAGEGSSALAQHLRTCERCLGLATQLRADTRLLAAALPAAVTRRRVARRTRYAVMAPMGLVAGMLALTVMRPPEPVPRVNPVLPPAVVTRTVAKPVAPAVAVESSASTSRQRTIRRLAQLQPRAFPAAVAVQPVRLTTDVPVPVPTQRSVVSVDPPAGTRAVVMHTNNPKLVVVWLF
jgi:hypothetical protein